MEGVPVNAKALAAALSETYGFVEPKSGSVFSTVVRVVDEQAIAVTASAGRVIKDASLKDVRLSLTQDQARGLANVLRNFGVETKLGYGKGTAFIFDDTALCVISSGDPGSKIEELDMKAAIARCRLHGYELRDMISRAILNMEASSKWLKIRLDEEINSKLEFVIEVPGGKGTMSCPATRDSLKDKELHTAVELEMDVSKLKQLLTFHVAEILVVFLEFGILFLEQEEESLRLTLLLARRIAQ